MDIIVTEIVKKMRVCRNGIIHKLHHNRNQIFTHSFPPSQKPGPLKNLHHAVFDPTHSIVDNY